MSGMEPQPISGHVYRHPGARGPVWRAKYRLPDGRQVHKTIGPVWSERGRPRAGYFTKRTAEAWLREVLEQAHAGVLPGMVRTGVSFADAAGEYLRYIERQVDRGVRRRAADHAEEREGPVGPVGAGRRRDARPLGPARVLGRRGRSRVPRHARSLPRR